MPASSPTVRASSTMSAAVIVNPSRVGTTRLRAAVTREEQSLGWQPHLWLETTPEDRGRQAARTALQQDPALVIVAGGDGTVRSVAEEVFPTEIPLAIVPAGTGNLLARDLGLMAKVEASVHTAFTGSDRVDDGFLDVVLLRPKGFWQWLRVGTRLGIGGVLKRSHPGRVVVQAAPRLRAMGYVQGQRLAARFDSPQHIELDGDSFGTIAARIGLRPHAVLVRVPAQP